MKNKYNEMQQVKEFHDRLLNMHLDAIRLSQAGFPVFNLVQSLRYYEDRLSGLGKPEVIEKRDMRVSMVVWLKNFVVRIFKKWQR